MSVDSMRTFRRVEILEDIGVYKFRSYLLKVALGYGVLICLVCVSGCRSIGLGSFQNLPMKIGSSSRITEKRLERRDSVSRDIAAKQSWARSLADIYADGEEKSQHSSDIPAP